MARVTLTGAELEGFAVEQPAASVRLLLPSPGQARLVVPEWNGNEFLLPDGQRPTLRTLTPRRLDAANLELDLDIVLHDAGAASDWATSARRGDPVAVSGPGRGYLLEAASGLVLVGDETAIPAISQLLEAAPAHMAIHVYVEVADPDARLSLPAHPSATISWHDMAPDGSAGDALVAAVRAADIHRDARIWAAGEAASMQRIRRHLFEERGFPRRQATVRGYWKHGRGGGSSDPDD